jgi:hypothetical protein
MKDMHPRKIAMHKMVYGGSLDAAGSRSERVCFFVLLASGVELDTSKIPLGESDGWWQRRISEKEMLQVARETNANTLTAHPNPIEASDFGKW